MGVILLDHRTGLTLYGIDKMLDGSLLAQFIECYLAKIREAKLQALLDDLSRELG